MPNTLHVDYELMTFDETVKIVEDAMGIARQEIPHGAAGCWPSPTNGPASVFSDRLWIGRATALRAAAF